MSSTARTTLKCREVRQAMVPFFEGTVPAATREALIAHLRHCRRCHLIYEEAAAVRRLLSGDSTPGDFPPDGLAERIKRAAREAQDDAQIRAGKAVTVVGSPAFVATCASLIIGAFMAYAMTTQVYERRIDSRIAADALAVARVPVSRSVVVAGPAATPSRPAAFAPPAPFIPFAYFAMAAAADTGPAAAATSRRHSAPVPRTRRPRAARSHQPLTAPPPSPRISLASTAAAPAAAATPAAAPRNPMVVAAAASVAGAATRAALLRASRVPATAPRPAAGERLAMASVEPTSSVASDDASAGLAASLVAHYVVERYVTEHLAQAAPALTVVAATHPATITSAGFESDL